MYPSSPLWHDLWLFVYNSLYEKRYYSAWLRVILNVKLCQPIGPSLAISVHTSVDNFCNRNITRNYEPIRTSSNLVLWLPLLIGPDLYKFVCWDFLPLCFEGNNLTSALGLTGWKGYNNHFLSNCYSSISKKAKANIK